MHELPANHQPVSLLGSEQQIEQSSQFLISKGYQVRESFVADPNFWHDAQQQNIVESGCHSVALWQANPLLIEVIELVEQHCSGRKALDIACGAGRDSVYLAKRGWDVTALDHKADALSRATQLAERSQTNLSTLLCDLENQPEPLQGISTDLVLIMRYLHRPLFPAIDKVINKNGLLVYSTFMIGSEKFGSPKNPAYLLAPGELAEQFSNYEILVDDSRELADGRPVALFVARKF